MVRRASWQVYFRGIPVELIPEAVAQAEARGADFAEAAPIATAAPPFAAAAPISVAAALLTAGDDTPGEGRDVGRGVRADTHAAERHCRRAGNESGQREHDGTFEIERRGG